ncbi:alpha/beta hydrolase [Pseudoroseomonas rhizosphaerae]|uniref:Palmitoyl-protein thioesterase ABHD10, mitochondrial n=1 Tax=Teichococcus rhizosphaerae TaxID=1335062 RepID=A0A2C7A9A8_9PROT|nr:alpha/beta hydrolase [Pseudoroseomonas rhizosphaerae]PHK93616.1 alpha/beta hydrolase [Pseudoroseomonas rhizosphaerae]
MSIQQEEIGRLRNARGEELAWARLPGRGPGVVFLAGFRSDMEGSKALHLRERCAATGRAFLRFDYAGHGISGGAFEEGCIGDWAEDAAHVIASLTEGPQVLVGSSMGGWIALLMARRFPERLHALVGIAAAPDFTETLMWPNFSADQQATLLREGALMLPSPYGPPVPITRRLIEDGRNHLLLGAPIPVRRPVRLVQGMRDAEVPWRVAPEIAARVEAEDARVTLVKDGDHRLARAEDLDLIWRTVEEAAG